MCCATAIIHRIDQTNPTNLDLKSTWHLLRAESCRKQYTCRSCWSSRKTMGFARYFSNHSLLAQTLNAGMNVTKMSRIYEFAGKLHQRWPTDVHNSSWKHYTAEKKLPNMQQKCSPSQKNRARCRPSGQRWTDGCIFHTQTTNPKQPE